LPRAPHLRPATRLSLLLLGALLCAAAVDVRAQPVPDDFLCIRDKPAPRVDRSLKFTPRSGLTLRNRGIGRLVTIDVRKPGALCIPASIAGGPVANATTFLAAYGSRLARTKPAQPKPVIDVQRITNRFGTDDLRLKSLRDVMVPTSAVLDPPPAPASLPSAFDDFACYDAERATGLRGAPAASAPLAIASAIGTWQLDVKAPTRVCFPSNLGGTAPDALGHLKVLACYLAKLTKLKPAQKPFPRLVATTNRFGGEQLALTAMLDVCVPSDAIGVNVTPTPQRTTTPSPTPTVTPSPDFTLKVAPNAVTVDIGTSAHFTATAYFKSGDVVDFTERVVWRSSTENALPLNEAGDRGRIDAVNGGSAVISAYDELTGVASTDTGDDAVLTVNWTLERIELLPETITRGLGESVRFRANGHFAGGYVRSIADRLTWASSQPNVADPLNADEPLDHSKVLAAGIGTATISATDPISGLTSTASGDDVTMTVVGAMQSCDVHLDDIGLGVGDFYHCTAVGNYPGGFTRNVTQQVGWSSDDPTVVDAPNTEGDRSRVIGVGPGETHVHAVDDVTGVLCRVHPLVHVASAYTLYLQPPDPLAWGPKRKGGSWHAIAIEKFIGTAKQYVTEDVAFSSGNPSAVAAPNVPGDRGRLDAVGSGTALVKATDPRNGLESQTIALRSLDGLKRVRFDIGRQKTILDVALYSNTIFLNSVGEFADGPATLDATDVVYESDNPTVADVAFHPAPYSGARPYWTVTALAPGVATISVTDAQTGISSDAFGDGLRIGVRGPVERITLVPPTVIRRAGEALALAAVVHYVGGATENATQKLEYRSGDESVAHASNDYGNRSRIEAVGAGTATISAVDPASGISSDDSGGSTTLTVVGPLTRIQVEPSHVTRSSGRAFSFTAIGTDADGRSINVTQDVVWSSSKPDVAAALNPEGNRSRIVGNYFGTATISAFDPENAVSSTATGDDATFTVDSYLTSLFLTSEETVFTVGDAIHVTALGTLNTGPSVNLTQEVEYTSSNPSVVKAENLPGDRSRLTALKAGSAIISARHLTTGVTTTAQGRVTLIITGP
jgi:hypothetical protein